MGRESTAASTPEAFRQLFIIELEHSLAVAIMVLIALEGVLAMESAMVRTTACAKYIAQG